MAIKDKFLQAANEYRMFQPGETVLVAVSGGADSTALLNLLNECRSELGISLHVAHLNHLLRKGDAELDVRFVEGLAQKLGIPITVEAVDVAALAEKEKMGIEEAARVARYDYFERTAEKIGASKVAVGHTADDNIETFLMRLLRGSGLRGLCGIPPKRGKIVRPLIKVWRREIEDYVGALKLVPRRDHTNYESRYLRNSVRLKLVPQLKIYNLNIKEIILQTILLLTEDNLYIENQSAEALDEVGLAQKIGEIKLNIDKFKKLDRTIQRYVLRLAIEKVKGNLAQLAYNHVCQILDKLEATEKWELHLPDGIYAIGERNGLTISRDKPKILETKPYKYALQVPGEVKVAETGQTVRASFAERGDIGERADTAFVDYSFLGKEVIVRNKLLGDKFSPLGVKGTKKLQDYFVDEKVPQEERSRIPIVESVGRIIWVAGKRLDDRVKVTDKTKKIVKLELL
ncbi:MAG: tRNA lysidine(34) synthetase TilS [Candidatus Margulisbacteria bacterium]|nr:tRNA lysidine(34) synthetase TilS [Candidatus Margulisiibacteriota bacterium]